MRQLLVCLLGLGWSSSALAAVQFCNKLERPVHFSVVYQSPQGWVSQGWFSIDPQDCVTPQSLADLTDFFWTAETGPYMLDGKEVKTTWGKGKTFSVKDFKDSPFTVTKADKQQQGSRLNPFTGPVSFGLPAIVATVTIEADSSSTTYIPPPPTFGPWAAIAADGNGRWGYAVGQPSHDVAANAALTDCDGSGCKILGALKASCLASAESREGGYWYFGFLGFNEAAVQNKTLNACNNAAPAGSCKLLKSICGPESASRASTDPKKDAESCMTTMGPDAVSACDRAIASGTFGGTDLATLHNQRGALHFMNQEDDAAVADLSEAIRLDGSRANYFGNRANAYISAGDYDKAISDFDEAIKLAPESASGYQGRALAYLKKGITGLARDDYNKALSLNPDADNRNEIEKALKELGPDYRNMKAQ